jgi:hypothetical protein
MTDIYSTIIPNDRRAAVRRLWLFILGVVLFAFPLRAQVMNKPEAAAENGRWLQAQFDGHKDANGRFIYSPPRIPVGTLFTNATVDLGPVIGQGRYYTDGGEGYPVGGHPWAAYRTRIVKTTPGPMFHLLGNGAYFVDPIELVGDGTSAAIVIEGRESPASGNHKFANITFHKWGTCFDVLGALDKKDDAHADNCIVTDCKAFDCTTFARFRNQQAVNWIFYHPRMESIKDTGPTVFFDIWRGGNIYAYNAIINRHQCSIFRLHEHSPNTSKLVFRDFERDRLPYRNAYLAPVEYAGTSNDAPYCRWQIEVSGFAPDVEAPFERRLPGCEKLPQDKWKIDVELVPK